MSVIHAAHNGLHETPLDKLNQPRFRTPPVQPTHWADGLAEHAKNDTRAAATVPGERAENGAVRGA